MLTAPEKNLLHLIAKYYYSGIGSIFDAGIFLGGCSEALLNGLAENKRIKPKKQLWAYDLAKAPKDDRYWNWILKNTDHKDFNGDFANIITENLSKLRKDEYYTFYKGDILECPYPEKIEIMFLDVCKCNKVNFKMQSLFNRLIPNKSIVIHQDYIYDETPELRVTMGYLNKYFEYIGCTPLNSAVFMLKKAIPNELLNINPYDEFSFDEVVKLHNHFNKYFTKEQVEKIEKAIDIIKKDKLNI